MGELDKNLTSETEKNLFGNAELNMLWACAADPRFCYRVHVPDYYREEAGCRLRLMVLIHGTGCAIEDYIAEARSWADRCHVAILAPLFPSGMIERADFNSYKLLSAGGIRYDQILLSMLDEMAERYPGIQTDKFLLFGHSGGGQFANRFLLVHPARLEAVSIGAPGRPTFLNFSEDYFWGVRNFREVFDKELDITAVRNVPVQITVGELDTKFIGESPYGANRVARMESLRRNFEENGIKTVEMRRIPGIEHADGNHERIQAATAFFEKYL